MSSKKRNHKWRNGVAQESKTEENYDDARTKYETYDKSKQSYQQQQRQKRHQKVWKSDEKMIKDDKNDRALERNTKDRRKSCEQLYFRSPKCKKPRRRKAEIDSETFSDPLRYHRPTSKTITNKSSDTDKTDMTCADRCSAITCKVLSSRKNITSSRKISYSSKSKNVGNSMKSTEVCPTKRFDTGKQSSISNGGQSCSQDAFEIPGFYYDPEKKKYFKIQANQFSKVEHTLTNESINKKRQENQRCKDLQLSKSPAVKKSASIADSCLPSMLSESRLGVGNPRQFQQDYMFCRISNIDKHAHGKPLVIESFGDRTIRLDHSIQLEKNKASDRIVGLYSVKTNLSQKIQLMKVEEDKRTDLRPKLSLNICPVNSEGGVNNVGLLLANKVTSMCWAEQTSHPKDLCILYSVISYVHLASHNYVSLHTLNHSTEGTGINSCFLLGSEFIWTCGWDKYSARISIGTEKKALLLDTRTRKKWEFNTDKSDVFSQLFSGKSRCLFSGTRNGKIVIHDLRSRSTTPVKRVDMSCSVCSLGIQQDDIHLLASDVKGKICLWDLRMLRSSIVNYYGNYNVYSRIPVHMEEKLDLVYGVDLNGYTRLWKMSDGRLLRTIPPPVPTCIETLPTVLYSENWGDAIGNAGLLMGINNKIYLYPS